MGATINHALFSAAANAGLAAALVNALGFAFYFKGARKSGISSPVGWFLSTVIALSSAVAQFRVSDSFSNSVSYFFGAACCAIALGFSAKNKLAVTTADALTAFAALLSAVLALANPMWSVYWLAAYYLLSYSVFLRSICNGGTEPVIPWLIWCIGALFQILSISLAAAPPQTYILPVVNLLCWSTVAMLANRQFQFQKRS